MNDDELDRRLRERAVAWREANQDRPAVDWASITEPRGRRGWLVAVAVAAVAIAIAVPLVMGAGSGSGSATHPAGTDSSLPIVVPQPPHTFWALRGTQVKQVFLPAGRPQYSDSLSDTYRTPLALGVSGDARNAYAAYPAPGCRTMFQRHTIDADLGVVVVPGRVASVPMAVSPDGTKLALVLDGIPDHHTGKCKPVTRLAVLTLATHQVREWGAPRRDTVRFLAWAPDSEHLADLTALSCAFLSFSDSVCYDDQTAGTRVLATDAPGTRLKATPRLLPAFGTGSGYGPVFWWRGRLVAPFGGSLRLLNGHGGLGKVVATGFPKEVESVSSDPSGADLLLTSEGTTYRWENGRLSVVKGDWTQPGW